MPSPDAPIRFFNPETGSIEEEAVYGEGFLHWVYGTPLGKLSLHALVKHPAFSKWYGWRMDRPGSREKVGPFIRDFGLDPEEFQKAPGDFTTFNDFFTRRLRPAARPIAPGDETAIYPADGRHLGFPDISQAPGIFVKGQKFDVPTLLGNDPALSERFAQGTLVISRLCPTDYHRFHFPAAGNASSPRRISGHLYSVSPIALRRQLNYFWENERVLTEVDSPTFGKILCIEVGATCVGTIRQTTELPAQVTKAQEKGTFAFGGSTTITVFEPGRVTLNDHLLEHSPNQIEVYAKMGQPLATLKS